MTDQGADRLAKLLAPPERIVRPRRRKFQRLPVVALTDIETLDENGQVGSTDELIANLRSQAPTLFIKLNAADFIARIDKEMKRKYPSTWQWRAHTHERDIVRPDGKRMASRMTTVVHYFGFKHGNYHKIIDPIGMYGKKLDEIITEDMPQLVKLLKLAISIRDYCDENGMEVRPTIGAIAGQHLTDPRFYPNPRRKVPRATNDSVREHLPGNFYSLQVSPSPHREYTALYLDQHRSHHYHARTDHLPDADTLYAYGRFVDVAAITFTDIWPRFSGLYCLDLALPEVRSRSRFIRNYLGHKANESSLVKAFVFSNELPYLLDMGYRVIGVRAAWGSIHQDTGLARYSRWAEGQLDRYNDASWLKPLLLATYGVLATRPKQNESVFRIASRGELVTLYTGRNRMTGKSVKNRQKLEPRIANVLHRAMIEAGCRIESIGYASHLEHLGYRVLCIYADAVIVQDEGDMPPPPLFPPWEVKATLHHLRFLNSQAFMSGEMTKLPGVSRELLDYPITRAGKAPLKIKKYDVLSGEPVYVDPYTGGR